MGVNAGRAHEIIGTNSCLNFFSSSSVPLVVLKCLF
jgi:hypothetical protein